MNLLNIHMCVCHNIAYSTFHFITWLTMMSCRDFVNTSILVPFEYDSETRFTILAFRNPWYGMPLLSRKHFQFCNCEWLVDLTCPIETSRKLSHLKRRFSICILHCLPAYLQVISYQFSSRMLCRLSWLLALRLSRSEVHVAILTSLISLIAPSSYRSDDCCADEVSFLVMITSSFGEWEEKMKDN